MDGLVNIRKWRMISGGKKKSCTVLFPRNLRGSCLSLPSGVESASVFCPNWARRLEFNIMKQVLLCVLLSLSLSANVLALGNAGAGKTKAAVCGGCHGVDGNSALPTYPKLAGQNERYIAQQLTDFKTGKTRSNAIMQGMATPLSRQDIADIGTYFQSQSISSTAPFDKEKAAQGRNLYNGGNLQTGVPACKACHGPAGAGNAGSGYPQLTGQYVPYTLSQLKAFKDGSRSNDKNQVMRVIVKKLTAKDMESVANYIASLKQ